jgi:hypothetical protein
MNKKIKRLIISVVLVLGLAGLIHEITSSMPSGKITIYSGPVGGSYYELASVYRTELTAMGYDVAIHPMESTAKLLETVNNSREPNTISFMIGRPNETKYPDIRSLGFVDVQPLFLFYSNAFGRLISLTTLKGRTIVLPPESSITSQTALKLLSLYNITTDNTTIKFLPFLEAIAALKNDDAYALFLMLDAKHSEIAELMNDPKLSTFSYPDMAGILLKLNDLKRVTISAGSYNVLNQVPSQPVDLLAGQVEIISNKSLDKAAAYALLSTFSNTHHSAALTYPINTYPSFNGLLVRPHEVTSSYAKAGIPWLYRSFTGTVAVLIDKYLIIGLAIFLLTEIYRSLRYLYEFLALSAETLALSTLKRIRLRQEAGKSIGWLGRASNRWAQNVIERKSIRQQAAEIIKK